MSIFPHRLLTDDANACSDLVYTPHCCLDAFTLKHLEKYPDEDQLSSPDSLAIVEALCVCGDTETVSLEWGHGRVNRLIVATSNQSKRPSLEFIGAQWLCQKHKQRQAATCTSVKRPRPSAPTTAGQGEAQPQASQGRRRRGGGGAWRAFVSMKTRGQKGRADLANLAQEYALAKRLGTAELAEARERGAAASVRHQQAGVAGFGPTTREYHRKRQSMQSASLSLSLLMSTPLAGHVFQEGALTETPSAVVDLKGQLTLVRKATTLQRRQDQAKREALMDGLRTHCEEQEAGVLESIFDVVPELHILKSSVHYVPHHSLLIADLVPNTYPELSMAVASFAKQKSKVLNLSASLKKDWQRRHESINAAAAPDTKRAMSKTSMCCQYGLCLCNDMGRQLLLLRNRFLKSLKEMVAVKDPTEKALLADGWLVVRLEQQRSSARKPSWTACAQDLLDTGAGPEVEWAKADCVWLHIAMQYFSPYRPTFQRLTFEGQDSRGRIMLRQTGHFMSEFRMWDCLDLEASWKMQFYKIVTGSSPVAHLRPSVCFVEVWKEEEVQLWPAPARGRKRGSKDQGPRRKRRAGQTQPAEQPGQEQGSAEAAVPKTGGDSDSATSSAPEDEAISGMLGIEEALSTESLHLDDLLQTHLDTVQDAVALQEEALAETEPPQEERAEEPVGEAVISPR